MGVFWPWPPFANIGWRVSVIYFIVSEHVAAITSSRLTPYMLETLMLETLMLVRPVLLLLLSMVSSHALPALFLSPVPVFAMFNPSSSATLKMCRRTSPCPLPAHVDTARGTWHEKGAEQTPHPGSLIEKDN